MNLPRTFWDGVGTFVTVSHPQRTHHAMHLFFFFFFGATVVAADQDALRAFMVDTSHVGHVRETTTLQLEPTFGNLYPDHPNQWSEATCTSVQDVFVTPVQEEHHIAEPVMWDYLQRTDRNDDTHHVLLGYEFNHEGHSFTRLQTHILHFYAHLPLESHLRFTATLYTLGSVDPAVFRLVHFPTVVEAWRRLINAQRTQPILHGDRPINDDAERNTLIVQRLQRLQAMVSAQTGTLAEDTAEQVSANLARAEIDTMATARMIPWGDIPNVTSVKSLLVLLQPLLTSLDATDTRHLAQGIMRLFIFSEHLQEDHYDETLQTVLDGAHQMSDVTLGVAMKEEFEHLRETLHMEPTAFKESLNAVLRDELFSSRARMWLNMHTDAIRRRLHATKAFKDAAKREGMVDFAAYTSRMALLGVLALGTLALRSCAPTCSSARAGSRKKRAHRPTHHLPIEGRPYYAMLMTSGRKKYYQVLTCQERKDRGLSFQWDENVYYVPFTDHFLTRGYKPHDTLAVNQQGTWTRGGSP